MSDIVLTGLSANDPTPGDYIQVNLAAGPSSGSGSARTILLLGNATAAGTGTAATIYGPDTSPLCATEADVILLAGTGSELHRMWLRTTALNTSESIYIGIIAESAGAKAVLDFTIAVVPTGAGTLGIFIEDELVEYSFAASDTLASITAGMVLAANANSKWAVTAAQATVGGANDTVRFTARQKGPRGNFLNGQSRITGGVGTTVTNTARAFFTGGTTADSNTNVLTAILPRRFDYIVSAAEDASQFGALITQIGTQALPVTGIRQRGFAGGVDATIGNVTTITVGINGGYAELIWQKSSDWTPAECAAHGAALYALLENSGSKPRHNFSLFPTANDEPSLWQMPAPRNGAAATAAEVRSALNNGVTPIGVRPGGKSFIWKRITTRSLNGSVNDYRARDAHKICELLFFADDLQAKFSNDFGGKDLVDEPKQGGPPVDGQTVSTSNIKSSAQTLVTEYGNANRFQNADVINAKMKVVRETSPTSRVSVRVPATVCDILDSIAIALDQAS